ncbi:MAG: GNAT family N-acetyltransferase [Oscillospiraceae bacterium]|jgi:predicted GNAT family acetyltransferase|nr:GNAT family N-acetyltransferase [Oscillospiraceae bacterium]
MKFTRYIDMKLFEKDTLKILLENEVQNNMPLSFIKNERGLDTSEWLLFTVKDKSGEVALTAACTPPRNIVMYETQNKPNDAAVKLLSDELKSMGISLPGVLAEQGLARRFAENYAVNFRQNMSTNVMRLDKISNIQKAPGFCRELRKDDLFYMPFWIKAFGDDCKVGVDSSIEFFNRHIGMNTYYIWEDTHPVSIAVNHRNTENGAGISCVYTPPYYRGKGYASSVVAELSASLLERGYKFCFLFADVENPVSCGIYRKIGFCDLCVFDEIKFGGEADDGH